MISCYNWCWQALKSAGSRSTLSVSCSRHTDQPFIRRRQSLARASSQLVKYVLHPLFSLRLFVVKPVQLLPQPIQLGFLKFAAFLQLFRTRLSDNLRSMFIQTCRQRSVTCDIRSRYDCIATLTLVLVSRSLPSADRSFCCSALTSSSATWEWALDNWFLNSVIIFSVSVAIELVRSKSALRCHNIKQFNCHNAGGRCGDNHHQFSPKSPLDSQC